MVYRDNEIIKIATMFDPGFPYENSFEVSPLSIAAAEESDKEEKKDDDKSNGFVKNNDKPDSKNLSSLKNESARYANDKKLSAPKLNENTADMAF
uniref:Uncharacterized protein n=1 Tax=Panagrolaimus sp. ES5 TaxID=591445 RepID=A0AC34GMN9_9BILA